MKNNNVNLYIRDIQLAQLEMLLELDRICKKFDIRYQLFSGTLLGCIRHNGFIPWDEDIDVCMIRQEYDRFLDIAKFELDKKYFLQTYMTDKNYVKRLARLRKNNTLYLQESYQYQDMHHGIPISIMPLDNIKPYTFSGELHRALYQLSILVFRKINHSRSFEFCLHQNNLFIKGSTIFLHMLSKIIPKRSTDLLQEKIACLFNNQDTEYITHLTNGATRKRYYAFMMKREEFYDVIPGIFEGYEFPIPRNYHKLLTNIYGDYMKPPPEDEQKSKHGIVKLCISTN